MGQDQIDEETYKDISRFKKRKDQYEQRELSHHGSKTRIWCPLRTCKFNKQLTCTARSVQFHLYSDGRMRCNTYIRKPGVPRSLDYFPTEMAEEWETANQMPRQANITPTDEVSGPPNTEVPQNPEAR